MIRFTFERFTLTSLEAQLLEALLQARWESLCWKAQFGSTRVAPNPIDVLRAMRADKAGEARDGGLALAEAVMSGRVVRIAEGVLEGGEFMDYRIAELSQFMIEGAAEIEAEALCQELRETFPDLGIAWERGKAEE